MAIVFETFQEPPRILSASQSEASLRDSSSLEEEKSGENSKKEYDFIITRR